MRTAGSRRASGAGSRSPIALARDPRLLLLDEPHAGLDEQGRDVLDEVVRAAPAEGRTVLLASHELDLARAARDARGPHRRRARCTSPLSRAVPTPAAAEAPMPGVEARGRAA